MSLPTSLRAYEDCRTLFDAAVADPKGARALGPDGSYESCRRLVTRLHYFRALDRRANAEIYPKGDPKHGTSPYDPFICQIIPDEDQKWWVYLNPITSDSLHIEGLSEVGGLIEANPTDIEAHEIYAIEDKSNA